MPTKLRWIEKKTRLSFAKSSSNSRMNFRNLTLFFVVELLLLMILCMIKQNLWTSFFGTNSPCSVNKTTCSYGAVDFTVLLCNCRSLCNKLDDARATCSSLHPHLFACTETWFHSDITDHLVSIPNYFVSRCDRLSRAGGGVAVYSSNQTKVTTLCPNLVHSPKCVEAVWLHLPDLNILFVCIYVPPSLCVSDHLDIVPSHRP